MSIEILTERTHPESVCLDALRNRRVAVLGYGNQGRAHALNLRDAGIDVVVGNRLRTRGAKQARADGFDPLPLKEAARGAHLVILALPDDVQGEVYRTSIEGELRDGAVLGLIHGFSVRFSLLSPREGIGIVLVAPKGPGSLVRSLYVAGKGVPALLAVERETPERTARPMALGWATGIGAGRSGIVPTTFAEETETDLFGEQAVLCGGALALVRAAFETLCRNGYAPELAYLECCHELKQVCDLLYTRGPSGMLDAISTTAAFGAAEAIDSLDTEQLRQVMDERLDAIRSGAFAASFVKDGASRRQELQASLARHDLESAGRVVRAMMPWLDEEPGEPA